jgi:hypothetical protein
MALLDSEIARIKVELGYNILDVGAEPYIGVTQLFEQVIQPYVNGGASTTSVTTVTASTPPTPAQKTIVLQSADGFLAGDVVVVDVDSRQERATAQSLTGTSLVLLLSKAHTGTYPVTVEGPETLIRNILNKLSEIRFSMTATSATGGTLKQVDEVQWYESKGQTTFESLTEALDYWREQLAAALGVQSMWSMKKAAACTLSVY